ncbi:MAG: polyphosphate polymerase domain-containing protein [Bacteroidales bacterium]|nr:polyphosphate polymerase domain-containing protein [Bacteroidales bacterium]
MLDTKHIYPDGELEAFAPITLEEMNSVKLMNRIDSKYLTDEATLLPLLRDAARAGYKALVTEGSKIASYDTLYYDTPGLDMFIKHHNRRLVRQKIRTRIYIASGLAFLEIKRKNNQGRTKKKRIPIPPGEFKTVISDPSAAKYIETKSEYSPTVLTPALETIFRRITLVNPGMTERVTIDTCLSFNNPRNGHEGSLRNGVIIELKQEGHAWSEMKRILLDHRVKPIKVSKYCIGTTLTSPDIKSNRFKLKVRRIEKQINNKLI